MTYRTREIYGGIYEVHGIATVDRRLQAMPYAQAGICVDQYGETLISYTTPAVRVENGKAHFLIAPDYSRTTGKHVGAFLREISRGRVDYHDAKRAYYAGKALDLLTGDLIEE